MKLLKFSLVDFNIIVQSGIHTEQELKVSHHARGEIEVITAQAHSAPARHVQSGVHKEQRPRSIRGETQGSSILRGQLKSHVSHTSQARAVV